MKYLEDQKMEITGVMSGTSLDGLDLALVCYENKKYTLTDFISVAFSQEVKDSLLALVENPYISLDQLIEANSIFTKFTAEQLLLFHRQRKVQCVGFSGQTIRHSNKGTLQIGSSGILSSMIEKVVVGDFRSQDIGAGGQGAPLISFVDQFLFCDDTPKILLNIGGIANLTFVMRGKNSVSFDTGPGNMLIDALMRSLYQKTYDDNGEIAMKGKIDEDFLNQLLNHPFFHIPPPKSTGRFDFGKIYLQDFITQTNYLKNQDKIATATELTIQTISRAISSYVPCKQGTIIVSGGGKHNKTIMGGLNRNLTSWNFAELSRYGLTEDAKEAFAFAVLAHRRLLGKVNHTPQTTGATRELVLGAIYNG